MPNPDIAIAMTTNKTKQKQLSIGDPDSIKLPTPALHITTLARAPRSNGFHNANVRPRNTIYRMSQS